MKILLRNISITLLLLLNINLLIAQPFGNEWINPDQTYYRFSIPQTGIYRVSGGELLNAGIPVGSFNPQNVRLIFKGEEIPCYIKGEGSGLIEYIEFYAEKNDGWFDVEMHDSPSSQANPHYSLINDTASVFFTWNTSFNNLRFNQETDVNFSGYTPSPYCLYTVLKQYTARYTTGLGDCEYVKGEGFVDNANISLGNSLTKTLQTPEFKNSSVNTVYDISFITFSSGAHHVNITGPGFEEDTVFGLYETIKFTKTASISSLNNETSIVFQSINDQGATTDFSAVSYISITYPRSYNINKSQSFEFTLPASGSEKSYLEFKGFVYDGEPYLYDLTRGSKIELVEDGSTLKALVPASTSQLKMLLVDGNYIFNVAQIAESPFIDHSNKDETYVIITHPTLWDEAQNYATYRNAYIVNVQELYNQFGYGIQKHPLAIRNFLNFIYQDWESDIESLFIIGKGIGASYTRNNPDYYSQCLIPPMGYPPSDILLSNKIGNTIFEAAIPTGRLAAQTENDIALYLDKVIDFESNEATEWMKRIVHFGGGSTQYEQNTFAGYLNGFENTITDTLFGGHVSTFLKTSSDPIAISKTDSITNLINEGVSLMTFFGHGSTNGFDQNIDEPGAYLNTNKYPLMIANSCYSGNIHIPGKVSTSEDWTLIENKGVIGFLAMVGEGYPYYLNAFTTEFYKNLGNLNYAESLGTIKNNACKKIQQTLTHGTILKSTIQEFTLHGDPGIVLNSFELPDFVMKKQNISFTPSILTTEIDSFLVNIALTNVSRAITQDFTIELLRIFQDGSQQNYSLNLTELYYKDTISFKLPVDIAKGQGINQFTVTLDAGYQIEELNENNNIASTNYFITSTDLFPIIPYKNSIIPTNNLTLRASTGDPFVENQLSVFQIDTSYKFNSPFLYEEEIVHAGGIIDWNPGFQFKEDVTYFWRTAKKETGNEELKWSLSAFTYENSRNGWQQNNFGQIIENNLQFIEPNTTTNIYEFTTSPKTLRFTNIGINSAEFNYSQIGYTIDGLGDNNACQAKPAFNVVVIDSVNLIPWRSNKENYGQNNYPNCLGREANYFVYHLNNDPNNPIEDALDNLVTLVNNIVPEGYYVLIYTIIGGNYSIWKERHYQAFESWGASQPRFLNDNQPLVFFTQAGNINSAQEWYGSSSDVLTDQINLKSNFTYGTISSERIGPSTNWESFEWSSHKAEDNTNELAFVKLTAIGNSGTETIIVDSLTNLTYDLSTLDANVYPYLKLNFYTKDEDFKTPSQLDYWKVIYSPVSDLAINPQKGWEFYSDTLQEGDEGSLTVAFENIGTTNMDSVLVKYWLQDSKNIDHPLSLKKLNPVNAGEYLVDTIKFETLNFQGNNSIWMELNPEVSEIKGYDQPEQFHFNNIAQKSFYVEKDNSNPILDVTFDGVHIMDGDLVSAKPEIVIQLSDENTYIPLNDTSLISVYLKSTNDAIEEKIQITNNPEVTFIEAELPENKAQIIFNKEFPENGTYELRVQAKDNSGNESGAFDYLISFRVINESTITHVFNYPNPFSTSTRFVFELTGSEIPDEMRIDILTVTGKLVKVIYLSDLGPITIGKNITNYYWDGTDMYGDALANGVYFYRVYAKINGESIKIRDVINYDSRSVNTSQYFKNGFGKMYLMR